MQYKIYNKFQWKKHVLQDLQPYSCIVEMCIEKEKTYGSRRGWVAHEFLHHRCSSEWHCIGNCGGSFSERCEFVAHILEDHLKCPNSGINIDEIVDSREQKSTYPPSRDINCPFCLERIEETKRTLQKHVGRHFDEIALKTLPQEVFDVQKESDILNDIELDDSDDWSRRSSFSALDEPVGVANITVQAVGTRASANDSSSVQYSRDPKFPTKKPETEEDNDATAMLPLEDMLTSTSVPAQKRKPRPQYDPEQDDFIRFCQDDLCQSWEFSAKLYNQFWHADGANERKVPGLQSRYYRLLDESVRDRKKDATVEAESNESERDYLLNRTKEIRGELSFDGLS
ncbi:hypothetical protein K440DRAFT_615432 [Wilcoxina mikolae CBS 423.85]|nr:hypothetical protein K440DRAFT_615432 [Wilcoxina mikolae CBS 423.85]